MKNYFYIILIYINAVISFATIGWFNEVLFEKNNSEYKAVIFLIIYVSLNRLLGQKLNKDSKQFKENFGQFFTFSYWFHIAVCLTIAIPYFLMTLFTLFLINFKYWQL
ncbi:MAG: hypothetical protein Q8R57_08170 [Bacteroidota bacterium]|nr:hypothetical protein [Bacteroidota bacterium]